MQQQNETNPLFALPEKTNIFAAQFLERGNPIPVPEGRYDAEQQVFIDAVSGRPALVASGETHQLKHDWTEQPGCFNQTTEPCQGCHDTDSTCTHSYMDFYSDSD